MGGMVFEDSLNESNEKEDIIIYVGTRICLKAIFSKSGWNSPGHPAPYCLIELPIDFFVDTVAVPYTFAKSVWNLYNVPQIVADQNNISSVSDRKWLHIFVIIAFPIFFSILGYKKAKQNDLNPIGYAFICFFYNFWGYLYLFRQIKKRKMVRYKRINKKA